jgi:hypothetical protein
MAKKRPLRRVLATIALAATIGVPAELGVTSLVATPAHALSCHTLANAMFTSRHHAVYWAHRYYAAGC